ncbi:hypothetical protein [Lacisediminimonas profundi]|uniref:hypothetical protein n=1 Tax=Lacisediminimonas profundi TaxID=2603856 RepID=UPI001F4FE0D5|nr:hypothetical protein [Lacisediminimonas profundi]
MMSSHNPPAGPDKPLLAARICGGFFLAIFLAMMAAGIGPAPALAASIAASTASPSLVSADSGQKQQALPAPVQARAWFGQEGASAEARQFADWVVDSRDNQGMPFIVIDKADARVFVFAADGRLRGAAAALLGLARGDDSVPDIGNRPLATIRPEERTTPAGRFVAALDRNLHGVEILWVDYDSALSLHRVVAGSAREQRAQRLATPSTQDNRISYGCINVPVGFYNKVVNPAFTGTNGIVYILPETRSLAATFPAYYPVSSTVASPS